MVNPRIPDEHGPFRLLRDVMIKQHRRVWTQDWHAGDKATSVQAYLAVRARQAYDGMSAGARCELAAAVLTAAASARSMAVAAGPSLADSAAPGAAIVVAVAASAASAELAAAGEIAVQAAPAASAELAAASEFPGPVDLGVSAPVVPRKRRICKSSPPSSDVLVSGSAAATGSAAPSAMILSAASGTARKEDRHRRRTF